MIIDVLPRAAEDLIAGFNFYEQQQPELGSYFLACLFGDIEALRVTAGVHARKHRYHRCISKNFPHAIYYRIVDDTVQIYAILDCRSDPAAIRKRLRG